MGISTEYYRNFTDVMYYLEAFDLGLSPSTLNYALI